MIDKIKYHKDNRKYFKVQRQVAPGSSKISFGYIVDFSKDFILLQETDDFDLNGYSIFPIKSIAEIQFNNKDKYYDKIMHLEGLVDKISYKHQVDLTSWTTIFKSIKLLGLNVVIKNEDPKDETFDIGPITKVTKTAVYIRYFDSQGFLDIEPTKISYKLITIVKFDEHYTNTMSKYLRERKTNTKQKS
ncbi:MAG: hypothetical protein IPP15_23525 [Saprospiraceae bacterium]|uniref:Uncharacterized protein n=1 Tax=Candidatus Opimibacter skivensis TaxID=2982028 RepID=A0A9D7SZZ0_9BACT|nr:hypothetical protein [Candidatus Opimibacter skivensis]